MTNDLALVSDAARMLAEARTLDDIRAIRNLAQRAQDYAKAARLGLEAQNSAAAIRLEAEARAGEMLADMKASGQRVASSTQVGQESQPATLADLGIEPDESSRWQSVARVPAEERAEYVAEATDRDQEVTRAGLLRHARDRAGERWDDTVERMQTPESRREASLHGWRAAITEAAQYFERMDPPPSTAEAENELAAIGMMTRRIRGGAGLEVVS